MAVGSLNINGSSSDILRIKYDLWISDIEKYGKDSSIYKDPEKMNLLKADGEIYNNPTCRELLYDINTISVGDEIIVNHKVYGDITFICIGKNHDAQNTITLMTKDILQIMPFDAMEPANNLEGTNTNGNNLWWASNIYQWMNSEADDGQWYIGQHETDTPPIGKYTEYNEYAHKKGLLSGFSNVFKHRLVSVDKLVSLSNLYGGVVITCCSKIFLLSTAEIGMTDKDGGTTDGTIYEYFNNDNMVNRRIANATQYCVNDSNFHQSILGKNLPWFYWLRTPKIDDAFNVCVVDNGGNYTYRPAMHGPNGLRFCCVITNN